MDILDAIKRYHTLRLQAEHDLIEALGFGNGLPAAVDLLVEEEINRLYDEQQIDTFDLRLLLRLHDGHQADRRGPARAQVCDEAFILRTEML